VGGLFLAAWSCGFGEGALRDQLPALADKLCAGGGGDCQHVADTLRQLGEGDRVGGAEFALPLGVAPLGPALGRDPVDARHVRRGNKTFALQQFCIALRAGAVGDDAVLAGVQVYEAEHFAADGLVADPEDEVVAPLLRLFDVRQLQQEGACGFGVHAATVNSEQETVNRELCARFGCCVSLYFEEHAD
jgi:hypothetical protein